MPRIYFDHCALSRAYDNQAQTRIRMETDAVRFIMRSIDSGANIWICGEVNVIENSASSDTQARKRLFTLMRAQRPFVRVDKIVLHRASELETLGFKPLDALHLASAEHGNCDDFISTDDRLLKLASRCSARLRVRARNPLDWVLEQMQL